MVVNVVRIATSSIVFLHFNQSLLVKCDVALHLYRFA